jgi:hypothetical protein
VTLQTAGMRTVVAWVLTLAVLIGGGVAVEALVGSALPTRASLGTSSSSRPMPGIRSNRSVLPCTADVIDRAAGFTKETTDPRIACAQRWAIATSGDGAATSFALLSAAGGRWRRRDGGDAGDLSYATLSTAIPFSALLWLATDVRSAIGPDVTAAILVVRRDAIASRNIYAASPVVRTRSGVWLATTWYARGCEVHVYRWIRSTWLVQGVVGLGCEWPEIGSGTDGYGGGITIQSLTGSAKPDFGVHTASRDNDFSVVSDLGGTWHLVPFDDGYAPTDDVYLVRVRGSLVETQTNICGCTAQLPITYLWEKYRNGTFQPTSPPGPAPRCTASALADGGSAPANAETLTASVTSSEVSEAKFVAISCADGWALAIGARRGTTQRIVGLFDQQAKRWRTVTMNDGTWLPDVVDVNLYRYTGRRWAKVGPTPRIRDGESLIGGTNWFAMVAGTGSSTPEFIVRGVDPNWSVMLSYAAGTWHPIAR